MRVLHFSASDFPCFVGEEDICSWTTDEQVKEAAALLNSGCVNTEEDFVWEKDPNQKIIRTIEVHDLEDLLIPDPGRPGLWTIPAGVYAKGAINVRCTGTSASNWSYPESDGNRVYHFEYEIQSPIVLSKASI